MRQIVSSKAHRLHRCDRALNLGDNICLIIGYCFLLSFLINCIDNEDFHSVINFGLFWAFGILAFTLRRLESTVRDKLLQQLAIEDERPPLFILRSFTNSFLTVEITHTRVGRGGGFRTYIIAETIFAIGEATKPFGQMVSLSRTSSESHEFGKKNILPFYTTDDNWQSVFLNFAHSSRAIFLIPGDTPGLAEEILILVGSELLNKTLVFMPSSARVVKYDFFTRENIHRKSEWERIQRVWHEKGLRLPDYSSDGMVYIPNEDFSVKKGVNLHGQTLQEAISELMPQIESDMQPLSHLMHSYSSLSSKQHYHKEQY